MALVEVFVVCATQILIDANATPDIPQGSLVSLDNNGFVVVTTTTLDHAVGVAADSRSAGTTGYTPESGSALSTNPATSFTGSLVVGGLQTAQRFTQNRVADYYNEVLAAGKMTVYHGGGEFWTSEYDAFDGTNNTFVPGTHLYRSLNNAGNFTDAISTETIAGIVGMTLDAPTDFPSGVPGTQTPFLTLPEGGNSLSWGTLLHLKLLI